MGITYQNLALLRYIQEKQTISLSDVSKHFQKNTTSIRREIDMINLYMAFPMIEIHKSICKTKMTYQDYAQFVQSITLQEYTSASQERMNVFIVTAYFENYVNSLKLYEGWGLSRTTKKQDMALLRKYLEPYGLQLQFLHKKGLHIVGDELQLRLLVTQILYPLFDLQEDDFLPRITNTPFEKMNYKYISSLLPYLKQAYDLMNVFLKNYKLSITNFSKKFLLLFICLMKHKDMDTYDILQLKLPLSPLNLYFCVNDNENRIYNIVLNLLDFSIYLDLPFDETLWLSTNEFVEKITACLTSPIYTASQLIQDCYGYFYKQIMRSYFHLKLEDKLVKNTNEHLPVLYQIIQKYTYILNRGYPIEFSDEQYTTLTFLFQNASIRNRLVNKKDDDDKKKIIIVSNSSYERIQYFITQLKENVEVTFVTMITLSELYRLEEFTYDYIFSLSERIYHILKKKQLPVIQLDYFLSNQDIERLVLYGFSRIKTKFLTNEFVKNIQGMEADEIEAYLKATYEDYFI